MDLAAHTPMPKEYLDALCHMTQLAALDLSRRPLGYDALKRLLSHLPRLDRLTINGCPVSFNEVGREGGAWAWGLWNFGTLGFGVFI